MKNVKTKYKYGDQLARVEGVLAYQRAVQEIIDDARSYELRKGTTTTPVSNDLNKIDNLVKEALDAMFYLYDKLFLETAIEDGNPSMIPQSQSNFPTAPPPSVDEELTAALELIDDIDK